MDESLALHIPPILIFLLLFLCIYCFPSRRLVLFLLLYTNTLHTLHVNPKYLHFLSTVSTRELHGRSSFGKHFGRLSNTPDVFLYCPIFHKTISDDLHILHTNSQWFCCLSDYVPRGFALLIYTTSRYLCTMAHRFQFLPCLEYSSPNSFHGWILFEMPD